MSNVILSNFIKLSSGEKRKELVIIFSEIKDKNNNCKIIYDKLVDRNYEITDELMIEICKEALELYDAIKKNLGGKSSIIGNTSAIILKKLYEAEKTQGLLDNKEAVVSNS